MNFDDISPEQEKNIREKLNNWAEKSKLPAEKSLRLKQMVKDLAIREKKNQRLKIVGSLAAVAVILIMFVTTWPGMRSWAVENLPVVGRYIANWSSLEKGWQWAEEHEMFQEILAAKTDQGYTFRVHRILADPTQTTIIYTVEGNNPASITRELGGHDILFNGSSFASGMGARGDIIDGVFVGSIELSDGLPEKSGTLKLPVRQIGNVKGNWDVSFPVNRVALTELTRIVPDNQNMALPNGILSIEELVLVPTQTVVKLRYKGEEHAPDLTREVKLITPGGLVKPRDGGAHGTRVSDSWEQTYDLEFQRLDPVPSEVTLELAGLVYQKGETRIPLSGKQSSFAPDGREVQIMDLQQNGRIGGATISYVTDEKNPWPFSIPEWQVLDEQGKMHRTRPEIESSVSMAVGSKQPEATDDSTDKEYELKLSWELPRGSKAVALINTGYWEYRDKMGSFTIQIPKD
ncbi:MAG: hypothetical protein VR67_12095 [Peptococcaceae bacterium BRH_c8a]|nr:MAG: hypothetical protein VR67_12095 [Peptococcaceae bacterium BRH_c8a]